MEMHQILIVIIFISSPLVISAWDIAVALNHEIQFLNSSGHLVAGVSESISDIQALTYSPEQQLMFFSDKTLTNGSIFSFQVITNATNSVTYSDIEAIVSKQTNDVHNIVYDHKTQILYWTNTFGHQIKWLKVGNSKTPQPGQVLFTFKEKVPTGIAIDSCKRYLYWTTIQNGGSTIERSLLDGSQREVLVSDNLDQPLAIILDQNSQRMYWIDDLEGYTYKIESATFDGKDRKIIVHGSYHHPMSLAIFQGYIYWTDRRNTAIWKLPINAENKISPMQVLHMDVIPTGITSADHMLSNDLNLKCNPVVEPTLKVIKATTEVVSPATIEKTKDLNINVSSYCLNEGLLTESLHCDCPLQYNGPRCEIDRCHNYCLQGVCEVDLSGPKCKKCTEGWSGDRCQINLCHNYCVRGKCNVKDSQPSCECADGWSGERCEIWHQEKEQLKEEMLKVCKSYCRLYTRREQQEEMRPMENCRCTNDMMVDMSNSSESSDISVSEIREECLWKEVNSVLLLVLAFVCFLLLILVAVLTKKVLTLRKRPRYKKRIIVSKKTTTPMTCRPQPEQCEITIENCCNMNICETPP